MAVSAAAGKKAPNAETAHPAPSAESYTPRVDFYETPDELVLQFDLPGVKADGIDLRMERDTLMLHGRVAPRTQQAESVRTEYGVGDFYRSLSIPVEIDTAGLAAELNLGVLTVHLPKHERAKPHRITVKAG